MNNHYLDAPLDIQLMMLYEQSVLPQIPIYKTLLIFQKSVLPLDFINIFIICMGFSANFWPILQNVES